MPHDCHPLCLQRTSTTHRVSPPPRSPDAWHAPPPACCPCLHEPRGLSSPCVLSPDPVTTPGCPVLGGCVRGPGGAPYRTALARLAASSTPCVLSPDPVTTPGRPVPGGCVRGGRQTALPRRAAGCVLYPQDPLTAARRPRSARTRTAPCPAAAPGDLPLAPAHVPAASAHWPAQHPTRRHSNQRRDTGADWSARYVGGTRRLPISPLIDTYLVPDTAPQGARSARYRHTAHHRP